MAAREDQSATAARVATIVTLQRSTNHARSTQVFLREAVELKLEEARAAALHDVVIIMQKFARRWLAVRR